MRMIVAFPRKGRGGEQDESKCGSEFPEIHDECLR
jgi:hypothetical protein